MQITNRFVQMFSIEFNGTGLGPDVAAARAPAGAAIDVVDRVDWPGGARCRQAGIGVIRSNRTRYRLEARVSSGKSWP